MKKCKIIVYAISKNEEQFVNRWLDSIKEADEIYVLDTGSTDNTVKLLKERGVIVQEKIITPWRFDEARNLALKMLPADADICCSLDLDEVIVSGWREKLEKAWNHQDNTRYRYTYHWKLNEFDVPLVTFRQDKIHSLKNYTWLHPVHEILTTSEPETYIETDIVIKHYPDTHKSRANYLPLLELSVKEDPNDDRNLHYLGREYMFYNQNDLCIATLHKHLACPNATWPDERCASMRFIARSYFKKNYLPETELWYQKAIYEAPYLKEPYVEIAYFYYQTKDYPKALKYIKEALKIKEKSKSYINEEFAWNDSFYDLVSIIYFYNGHPKEAIKYLKKALKINPNVPRYQSNLKLMSESLKASHE